MSHPVWRHAAGSRSTPTYPQHHQCASPGLVLILQQGGGAGGGLGVSIGCSLIDRGVDRVCLVGGGTAALFQLPNITDFFVSPSL